MKTKWIALRMPNLVPLIIASVMGLTNYGCEEGYWDDFPNEPEENFSDEFLFGHDASESFTVFPGGSVVQILDGVVTLEFPEGAVAEPTKFTLSTSALDPDGMYEYNLMNRAISLKPELASKSGEFEVPVKIKMNYDESRFIRTLKSPEDNLTIYNLNDIYYAYSIGDCCVDCECKTVDGCINQCGIFVVGEN
jgi:hypothetical protein